MFLVSSCSCLYPIHWSQVLSREWRCSWSSADRRCSNYIWVMNNLIASYIRDLTVHCKGKIIDPSEDMNIFCPGISMTNWLSSKAAIFVWGHFQKCYVLLKHQEFLTFQFNAESYFERMTSKVPFDIPQKLFCPYIDSWIFYCWVTF